MVSLPSRSIWCQRGGFLNSGRQSVGKNPLNLLQWNSPSASERQRVNSLLSDGASNALRVPADGGSELLCRLPSRHRRGRGQNFVLHTATLPSPLFGRRSAARCEKAALEMRNGRLPGHCWRVWQPAGCEKAGLWMRKGGFAVRVLCQEATLNFFSKARFRRSWLHRFLAAWRDCSCRRGAFSCRRFLNHRFNS